MVAPPLRDTPGVAVQGDDRVRGELWFIAAEHFAETLHALDEIEDKVWRAYGLMTCARSLSFDEMMNLLSAVRLGVSMKLLPRTGVSTLNQLLLWTQVAHLEKRAGRKLDKREREIERASLVREMLAEKGQETDE